MQTPISQIGLLLYQNGRRWQKNGVENTLRYCRLVTNPMTDTPHIKACEHCGKGFVPRSNHQISCRSKRCLSIAQRKRHQRFFSSRPGYHSESGKVRYQRNREWYLEYSKKRRVLAPEKSLARDAVHRAVAKGELVPEPCKSCGSKNVEAHHPDYSQQLMVLWLCRKHHVQKHSKAA